MSKTLEWGLEPRPGSFGRTLRRAAASALHGAGRWLDRWASALEVTVEAAATTPVLEFHAEAGAPEGALFVDGVRVGVIHGVRRL
jgi:hypothetical protein